MLAAALTPLLTGRDDAQPFRPGARWRSRWRAGVARGRPAAAGLAVLGLAVMTKGFPIVAVPPALAWLVAAGRRRRRCGRRRARGRGGGDRRGCGGHLPGRGLRRAALPDRPPGPDREHGRECALRPRRARPRPRGAVASNRSDGLEHPAGGAIGALLLALLCALVAVLTLLAARTPAEPARSSCPASPRWPASRCSARCSRPSSSCGGAARGPGVRLAHGHPGAGGGPGRGADPARVSAHDFDLRDRQPLVVALVCLRNGVLLGVLGLAVGALQPGGEKHLGDARGQPALATVD